MYADYFDLIAVSLRTDLHDTLTTSTLYLAGEKLVTVIWHNYMFSGSSSHRSNRNVSWVEIVFLTFYYSE